MKVSLNWVRELSGVTVKTPELLELIGGRLGAIDEVLDIGEAYKGVTIVKVVECSKHPDADKLHVCFVDDKAAVKNVKRDSRGLVQVVCGAPNVRAGMLAAWIPPGATVPSTFDSEPFVLEAKELRGVVSNGMLASAKELGLGDNHEGLLELEGNAKVGAGFSKTYELDDTIIDIENKMFTHRPDCFGQLGVAREIAGITHKKFASPGWYQIQEPRHALKGRAKLPLIVRNDVPKWVPQFCTIVIEGIEVGPSPIWLQSALSRLGMKSLNNVVDITNYIMLLTAQPLHAYDYDKLSAKTLGVRLSRAGEELKLLGGKQIKLGAGAIVITDGNKPIGLGGIMGGELTEVDSSTKNIILEAASFDMGLTRRTAFDYGLFTEAATRFTKNQSPLQSAVVLARTVELMHQLAGGIAGSLQGQKITTKSKPVEVSPQFINKRLGTNLQPVEMKRLLQNVEFDVKEAKTNMLVTPPFWRTDIEIAEDIVEEVGRMYGYEHLPLQLPRRDIRPLAPEPRLGFRARLSGILAEAGANEVLTYSFVSADLLEKAKQNPRRAYKLSNPMSPEFEYYRLSLIPSLLDKVHQNIKQGYDQFTLFELGKSHDKNYPADGQEKVPKEFNRLALIFASAAKAPKLESAAYYQARAYLDFLADKLGITFDYEPVNDEVSLELAKPFLPGRCALVAHQASPIGVIGEFRSQVVKDLKLPKLASGFEVDIDALSKAAKNYPAYRPINRFPALDQDICLRMNQDLLYKDVIDCVDSVLTESSKSRGYIYSVKLLDIFQKTGSNEKQITWRISLSHPERTMVTAEATKVLDKIAAAAKQKFKASRV